MGDGIFVHSLLPIYRLCVGTIYIYIFLDVSNMYNIIHIITALIVRNIFLVTMITFEYPQKLFFWDPITQMKNHLSAGKSILQSNFVWSISQVKWRL